VSVAPATWALLVFGYASVPLVAMIAYGAPPVGPAWDGLMAAGTVALGALVLLPVLSARSWAPLSPVPGFSRFVHGVHRQLSHAAAVLLLVHAGGLLLLEPLLLEYLKPSAPWPMLSGVGAALLLAALVFSALGRDRLGVGYRTWRRWHAGLSAAAVLLTVAHVACTGHYFSGADKLGALILVAAVPTVAGFVHARRPVAAPVSGAGADRRAAIDRRCRRVVAGMVALWSLVIAGYALHGVIVERFSPPACVAVDCS